MVGVAFICCTFVAKIKCYLVLCPYSSQNNGTVRKIMSILSKCLFRGEEGLEIRIHRVYTPLCRKNPNPYFHRHNRGCGKKYERSSGMNHADN